MAEKDYIGKAMRLLWEKKKNRLCRCFVALLAYTGVLSTSIKPSGERCLKESLSHVLPRRSLGRMKAGGGSEER